MTATKFDLHPGKTEWLEHLADLLPRGGQRILDLGCGHGHAARYFCERHEYVGVDAKAERVEVARDLYPKGTFVQANYTRLELPRSVVDAVIAVETFHYPAPDLVAPTVYRIATWLSTEGYFLIYTGRRVASQFLDGDLIATAGLRTIELKVGPLVEGDSPKSLWLLAQKAAGPAETEQRRAPFGEVVSEAALAARRKRRRQRATSVT
jgi:SAM-dependent methyltransferase